MALTFGAAVSDRVDCGSNAVIDQLDPWSVLMWVYPTTLTASRAYLTKGLAGTNTRRINIEIGATTSRVVVRADRATSDLLYVCNTGAVVTNAWQAIGVTFHSANAANSLVSIYVGTLSTAMASPGLATTTDGAGALQDDSGDSLIIGNQSVNNFHFQGAIAVVMLFNVELTLGQLQSLQFRPRPIAGCVGFWHLGANGVGSQPDWSGNANAGTVTGATVSDHVPLGPWFGHDTPRYWPAATTIKVPLFMQHYRQQRMQNGV